MKSLAAWGTTLVLMFGSISVAASASGGAGDDAVLPAGAPAERAAGKVTLRAKSAYVPKGGLARLSGQVKGAGKGRVVVIYQKNVGRSRWVVEARKTTNRAGRFSHREDVNTGARYYQACSKGKCSQKVLVKMGKPPKPPKPPKQPTTISVAGIAPTSIEAGQAVNVSGTASANMAGQTIYLQAYDAGSTTWGAVGSARVEAGGSWIGAATLTTAGRAVSLRAVFNGTKDLLGSSADAGAVSVFGWYYIYDDGPPETVTSGYDAASAAINGVTYTKSLVGYVGSEDIGEYNIARSCTRFAAVLGLRDDAPTTSRVSFQVVADSVTKWTRTDVSLGQAYPVDVDITGALRLKLSAQLTAGDSASEAFGDARVLCAF